MLPPCPINKSSIQRAGILREEIRRKIKAENFNYAEYFPDSARAADPKQDSQKMDVLLAAQLEIYQRQETDAQVRKTFWMPLCARAKIKYRNPYQVRHTFASSALTAGANPWYVAAQLGHEDVEMVFRTYGKFIREDYQKPKPEFRIVEEK